MDDHETAQTIIYAISGVLLELGSFVIVFVCTVTLVVKLQDKTKWRQMSTASGQADNASTRDQKVTKMVMVISSLFIVCFSSTCMTLLAMMLEPELSVGGRHRNLFICVFSICFVLESANSAMNIFIYYHMSSKYKNVLRLLCARAWGTFFFHPADFQLMDSSMKFISETNIISFLYKLTIMFTNVVLVKLYVVSLFFVCICRQQ